MTQTHAGMIAIRVEADASIVAVIDSRGPTIERARRVPGGTRAVDDRILELVASEVDGLPNAAALELAAIARLRDGIAAARTRLVDEESTSIPVRYAGRMAFVRLERDAVAAAARAEIGAIAAVARELGAGPRTRLVALDGVADVPGLLRAIPGRSGAAFSVEECEALLDTAAIAVAAESALPPVPTERPGDLTGVDVPGELDSSTERPMVVLRPLWPTMAAVVVLLGLGGTAAAIGLGPQPVVKLDPVEPTVTQTTGQAGIAVTSAPTSMPAPPSPTPGAQGGVPTSKKVKSPTTGGASGAGSPVVSGSGSTTPTTPVSTPTLNPTTDPSPAPTPTDSGDPGGGSTDAPTAPIGP